VDWQRIMRLFLRLVSASIERETAAVNRKGKKDILQPQTAIISFSLDSRRVPAYAGSQTY
jgi:hypothetical protein